MYGPGAWFAVRIYRLSLSISSSAIVASSAKTAMNSPSMSQLFTILSTVISYSGLRLASAVLFLDGHSELINKNDWKRGDVRGVVFKDIHGRCIPNMH